MVTRTCRVPVVVLLGGLLAACGDPQQHLTPADLANALEREGLAVAERETYAHAVIEAIDGRGLRVNGDLIEVYEFDLCVASGREAIVRTEDDGVRDRAVIRRHNLVLVENTGHRHWEVVRRVFLEL